MYKDLTKRLSTAGHRVMVAAIWLYAFVLVSVTWFGKHGDHPSTGLANMLFSYPGHFGFDKQLGKCDYVATEGSSAKTTFWTIGFGIPLFLIVIRSV